MKSAIPRFPRRLAATAVAGAFLLTSPAGSPSAPGVAAGGLGSHAGARLGIGARPPVRPSAAARGRDPLGPVRTAIRHRVWVLFDTSTSMRERLGTETRFAAAQRVIRWAVDSFVSEAGEPLVQWRLAAFQPFRQQEQGNSPERTCRDPTRGAGLPVGSPPGPPVNRIARCGGVDILSEVAGCDAGQSRLALLQNLPRDANADRTPNGIALYQLASHIAQTATEDLDPGQKNIILLITDGVDTCECVYRAWLDFNDGEHGYRREPGISLRTSPATPDPIFHAYRSFDGIATWNAGLKARAAHLALNGGDPDAGLGDIHVIGVAMGDEALRGYTNHLAWMASGGRRPAIHADRPETLREALDLVLDEVTLPAGTVKLSPPRLASVKEVVAPAPGRAFAGTDPSLPPDALVADPGDPKALEEVLTLRASFQDNVLLSTSADLVRLEGGLEAVATGRVGNEEGDPVVIWDAGRRLAERDPADRVVLFNRPGSADLRRFRPGEVRPADLGVAAGYLKEVDGIGARTATDAAEIVVRLVLGEELALAPETGTIYDASGRLHFVGGPGTWKLREGLAAPVAVPNPPRHPERVTRNAASYRRFFEEHLNRRTTVYLPTSGGLLHAFAGDTGEELFAYIPDDVLGPAAGEPGLPGDSGRRTNLRELAVTGVRGAAGLRRGLRSRFALAGSPVVRDVFHPGIRDWRTVLAFGRAEGGRFVTALDVSEVGADPRAAGQPPGAGLPRLLFNLGDRPAGTLPGPRDLGETPPPLLVEVPSSGGSEWLAFVGPGLGDPGGGASLPGDPGPPDPGDSSGEWLQALGVGDGRLRSRFRLTPAPSARLPKNGAPAPPVAWQPAWGAPGGVDLVTRIYVADLHGQIHRLRLETPGAWEWRVMHSLGGEHPVLTPPVAFAFPGRREPHLLVVAGGDARAPEHPAALALLRDLGTHFEEVWRKELPGGEIPEGNPVVRTDGERVEVVLVTRTVERNALTCDVIQTTDGISRLRAFDGRSGAPLAGVVGPGASVVAFGKGRIRGISLSRSGNMALSVSGAAGEAFDALIGDFTFRIRDGALEPVTLFVEGFRRSPFWTH